MVIKFLKSLTDANPAAQYLHDERLFKGGGTSAPEAPDPNETAAAQSQYDKETALWNSSLNNVNQFTPYGSQTFELTQGTPEYDYDAYNKAMDAYTSSVSAYQQPSNDYVIGGYGIRPSNTVRRQDSQGNVSGSPIAPPDLQSFQTNAGVTPQWTSTTELSPEMQGIFDSQMRQQEQIGGLSEDALNQVQSAYSTPYNYDNIQSVYGQDDLDAARKATEDAIYSRLNPQFDRDEEAMRTRLINQGIGQNSEAYNREMERFGETKNDARMQAVLAGGAESDRALQQSMALRQQGISELDKTRQQPLNEYLAMSGQQQLTNPQFSQYNYAGAQSPDYAGAVNSNYQAQLGAYNSNQASQSNALGSALGLAGSIGGGFLGGPAGAAIGGSLFGGVGGG